MKPLPDTARQMLEGTLTKQSTWATVSSVAWSCYARGWNFEDCCELIWHSELGRQYAAKNNFKTRGQFNKNIRGAWDSADEKFDPEFTEKFVRDQLTQLQARIRRAPWPGRGGSSERAVALALVTLGHEVNRHTVNAGFRDIALRAQVGTMTAKRAVARLVSKGLVKKLVADPLAGSSSPDELAFHSTTYEMNLDWGQSVTTNSGTHKVVTTPTMLCVPVLVTTVHPAFAHQALGRSAGRIWDYLTSTAVSNGGATLSKIKWWTGLSENCVRTHLKRMVSHGLVVKVGQRNATYTANHDADLGRIADEYGTSDWQERTLDRYDKERAGYAQWLSDKKSERQRNEPKPPSDPFSDSVDDSPFWKRTPVPVVTVPDPFLNAPVDV